jgi:hypothetical protein
LPRLRETSRVLGGIAALIDDGFLTPFDVWQKSGRIAAAPETLCEADRCAERVLQMLS